LCIKINGNFSSKHNNTRVINNIQQTTVIQKVRRLTQLSTRYAYHILSLFNTANCNWNALGPAFLQSSDPVVEELLFLVFQPAIYRAGNVLVVRKFCVFSWILSV